MIVPPIEVNGEIGPNIPEGVEVVGYVRNEDGTYTLTLAPAYLEAQRAAETAALKRAARVAVAPRLAAGDLKEAEIADVAAVFDPWTVGTAYAVGDVVAYDGGLWECRQAHTSQADWRPEDVLALWQRFRGSDAPDETPEWATATPYSVGDEVTYQGRTYRCRQAHTSQAGWQPPNVPALWLAL